MLNPNDIFAQIGFVVESYANVSPNKSKEIREHNFKSFENNEPKKYVKPNLIQKTT